MDILLSSPFAKCIGNLLFQQRFEEVKLNFVNCLVAETFHGCRITLAQAMKNVLPASGVHICDTWAKYTSVQICVTNIEPVACVVQPCDWDPSITQDGLNVDKIVNGALH